MEAQQRNKLYILVAELFRLRVLLDNQDRQEQLNKKN